MRLAIIGTSITNGHGVPAGSGYAARLAADPAVDAALILGRNGATVRRCLPGPPAGPHYADLDQLTGFAPTDALLEFGANDWLITRKTADYKAHLIQLVGIVRAKAPGVGRVTLLHTYPMAIPRTPTVCDIPPCDPANPAEPWHVYGVAMWEASVQVGAEYIDAGEGRDWSRCLGSDSAHLTAHGHAMLHQVVRDRLLACC